MVPGSRDYINVLYQLVYQVISVSFHRYLLARVRDSDHMSKYFKMISRAMDQRNEPRLGFAKF